MQIREISVSISLYDAFNFPVSQTSICIGGNLDVKTFKNIAHDSGKCKKVRNTARLDSRCSQISEINVFYLDNSPMQKIVPPTFIYFQSKVKIFYSLRDTSYIVLLQI